jgi:hypothetical protein
MKALLVCGAIAAGTLGAYALPASADVTTTGGQSFTVYEIEKGSTFGLVDNAPKSPRGPHGEPTRLSIGDQLAFSTPLQNAAHRPMGRVAATCTVTKAGSFRTVLQVCIGAMRLRGGELMLAATIVGEAKRQAIAVIGGTGAYVGARGEIISTETRTGATDVVTLLP